MTEISNHTHKTFKLTSVFNCLSKQKQYFKNPSYPYYLAQCLYTGKIDALCYPEPESIKDIRNLFTPKNLSYHKCTCV